MESLATLVAFDKEIHRSPMDFLCDVGLMLNAVNKMH